MTQLRKQSLAGQLKSCGTLLANGRGVTEIKTLMAQRGYDTAELNVGQGLLNAATAAVQSAQAAGGDAALASQAAHEAEDAVRAAYRDLAKTARTVFRRDKPSRERLGLVGPEPRKHADF